MTINGKCVTASFEGDEMTQRGHDRACGAGDRTAGSESGFALVLALLTLMLLTFLGLTLATSTTTELRIATNYRWQQQALYNAEAGVEAGKALLRAMNWQAILPAPRDTPWSGIASPSPNVPGGGASAPFSRATRNFEGWQCDKRGNGMGYGVVLDDFTPTAPYQYKTNVLSQSLNGAFTLWVRRPPFLMPEGGTRDYGPTIPVPYTGDNNHLILVSEGVAPYTGAQMASSLNAGNAAVQVIEVLLSRGATSASSPCGTRGGQAGQGSEGSGFSACDPVTGAGIASGFGAAATGTSVENTSVK
jgi:hypothetical protein